MLERHPRPCPTRCPRHGLCLRRSPSSVRHSRTRIDDGFRPAARPPATAAELMDEILMFRTTAARANVDGSQPAPAHDLHPPPARPKRGRRRASSRDPGREPSARLPAALPVPETTAPIISPAPAAAVGFFLHAAADGEHRRPRASPGADHAGPLGHPWGEEIAAPDVPVAGETLPWRLILGRSTDSL